MAGRSSSPATTSRRRSASSRAASALRRAREAPPRPREPPPPRRAHEPPRSRLVGGAHRGAEGLRRDARLRLAQPELREPARDGDLGGEGRRDPAVPGEPRRLVLPPAAARGRGEGPSHRRPVPPRRIVRGGAGEPTRSAGAPRPRRGTPATGSRSRSATGSAGSRRASRRSRRTEREATEALADPALYQDFARAKPFIERQHAAKAELEALCAEWAAPAPGRGRPPADAGGSGGTGRALSPAMSLGARRVSIPRVAGASYFTAASAAS